MAGPWGYLQGGLARPAHIMPIPLDDPDKVGLKALRVPFSPITACGPRLQKRPR